MALSFSWLPLMFRVRGADMPNPLVVKGKGRPKGSSKFGHSHAKGHGESSTRRDPSLFEHEAIELPSIELPSIELPSSTAPAALPSRPRERSPELEIIEELSTPSQATQATRAKPSILTTKLAIQRGASTNDDPYKPGTLRERAYLRSLNPIKLADQVDIEILDTKEEEKALEEEEWLDIEGGEKGTTQ
jgi:hypothetical protein